MLAEGALLKLAIAGVVAGAAYEFIIRPELARKKTEADLVAAAKAKGGGLDDALKSLGKAGCQAYAASNGMPPSTSGGLCSAVATIGVAGLKYGVKYGAKGAVIVGKDVGKGAKAVGKAVGKAGKEVASVASHLKFWGLEGLHC